MSIYVSQQRSCSHLLFSSFQQETAMENSAKHKVTEGNAVLTLESSMSFHPVLNHFMFIVTYILPSPFILLNTRTGKLFSIDLFLIHFFTIQCIRKSVVTIQFDAYYSLFNT